VEDQLKALGNKGGEDPGAIPQFERTWEGMIMMMMTGNRQTGLEGYSIYTVTGREMIQLYSQIVALLLFTNKRTRQPSWISAADSHPQCGVLGRQFRGSTTKSNPCRLPTQPRLPGILVRLSRILSQHHLATSTIRRVKMAPFCRLAEQSAKAHPAEDSGVTRNSVQPGT